MCVCVCVCVRARARACERERGERDREKESVKGERYTSSVRAPSRTVVATDFINCSCTLGVCGVCVRVCVRVCECARDREGARKREDGSE